MTADQRPQPPMKADELPQPPGTHSTPEAPTRGSAPARGRWGRDSPMLGGVTGGVIPPGVKMRPDPERARLAAEALARARADAWARGDRPGTPQPQQNQTRDSKGEGLTQEATLSPSWSARPRRDDPQPLTAAVGGLLSARGWRGRGAGGAVFRHSL